MLVATVASYALGMSVFQNVIPARRTAQLKGLTGVNNNQRLANARQNSLNRNGASSNISNARKALKDEKPELIIDTDSIPDSLLHPRWRIQRTTPISLSDLEHSAIDLQRPENIKYNVEYNDTIEHSRTAWKELGYSSLKQDPEAGYVSAAGSYRCGSLYDDGSPDACGGNAGQFRPHGFRHPLEPHL